MKKQIKKPGSANKIKGSGQKKSNIHLPFSSSDGQKQEKKDMPYNPEPKKTQIGRQPGFPSSSQKESRSDNGEFICPQCSYPLRTIPEISSPCPNCGYTGESGRTVSDSGKTMPVSSLEEPEEGVQEFTFFLTREADNSEIKIESPEENEVILNRSHLDPANTTISSDQHVIFRYRNNKIYIEDLSSNGSTFIQAKKKMLLNPGSRIVIGNKILLFNPAGIIPKADQAKATRKFGEFDLAGGQGGSGFTLLDEKTGQQISFNEAHIVLNRSNLEPDNNTISSAQHTEIEHTDGKWFIKDLSSNESTFIQLNEEHLLENHIRIILGNRIFRFKSI